MQPIVAIGGGAALQGWWTPTFSPLPSWAARKGSSTAEQHCSQRAAPFAWRGCRVLRGWVGELRCSVSMLCSALWPQFYHNKGAAVPFSDGTEMSEWSLAQQTTGCNQRLLIYMLSHHVAVPSRSMLSGLASLTLRCIFFLGIYSMTLSLASIC